MIPNIVREAYDEYMDYLNEGGDAISIPDPKHNPENSVGKVHASALGRCPLNAAKSRASKHKHSFSTKHLMLQGKRDAEPIQEAMWWKYPMTCLVEHSVERPPFRGRFDIYYNNEAVIELKRRDGQGAWKNGQPPQPQPRLTDVYQIIAYSYMTGHDEIWLSLVTRYDLYFWKLQSSLGGFILVNEDGELWKSQYNNVSYLNYDVLLAEAHIHQQYLNGERDDDPIPDFLVNRGWQCGHFVDGQPPKQYKGTYKGEEQRTSFYVPTCPFFQSCKKLPLNAEGLLKVEEIGYNTKDYRPVI